MKISLEKGLENIGNYLESRGYEIVPQDSVADAYIYENTPISQIPVKNFSPIASLASDPVLLVNAKGKTFEEIEIILSRKTYNNGKIRITLAAEI